MIVPATPAEQLRTLFESLDAARAGLASRNSEIMDKIRSAGAGMASLQIPNFQISPKVFETLSKHERSPVLQQVAKNGQAARDMAAQRAGETHNYYDNRSFHTGFVDTAGATAFLQKHGDKLAKTIVERQTLNPSLRPKY